MWRSACSAAALWSSWNRSLTWTPARPLRRRLRQLRMRWQKLPGKLLLPAPSFAGMKRNETNLKCACIAGIKARTVSGTCMLYVRVAVEETAFVRHTM